MRAEYTHTTVLLDRTGSMELIRDDTIGRFNAFLEEQREAGGRATLTVVQFDSQDPYEVLHGMVPVADIPDLTRESYVPRATTPLLDAIGRGINDLEASNAALSPEARPDRVVMVIIPDGRKTRAGSVSPAP